MRKVCILLAMSLVLGCTACSDPSKPTSGSKEEKVKIEITYALSELGSDETTVEGVFANFLKNHPNIEIVCTPMSSQNATIMTRIAAGNPPDIIRMDGLRELPTYVMRGLAMPLDDYIAKSDMIDLNDCYDIVNMYRFDGKDFGKGKLYGAQKDWGGDNNMWVNAKLLRDAGLRVPTDDDPYTWAEFAAACKKVSVIENETLKQVGFSWLISDLIDMWQLMLIQKGSTLWSADYSTIRFDDPAVREVVEFYYDLQKSGAMVSALNPIDSQSSWATDGKIGFTGSGYWASSYFKAADAEDRATVDLADISLLASPVFNKGDKLLIASTGGSGAVISKDTKHPEEAFAVWEYIHFGELADMRAKKGFGLPLTKSRGSMLPETTPFEKNAKEAALRHAQNMNFDYRSNPYLNAASVNALFDKYWTPLLYGEYTLDETLAIMKTELEILIKEGKEQAVTPQ